MQSITPNRILFSFAICIMLILPLQSISAQALQAEMLLKLIALNQNPDFIKADDVRILIVYDISEDSSKIKAGFLKKDFSTNPDHPFSPKPLIVQNIPNSQLNLVDWKTYHAVIIVPGKNNQLKQIRSECSKADVFSLTTQVTLVSEGISAAVAINSNGQPELWFNVPVMESQGVKYSADVLRLAQDVIW